MQRLHRLQEVISATLIKEDEYKPKNIENAYAGLSTITINMNTVMKNCRNFRQTKPKNRTTQLHPAVLRNCAVITSTPLTMTYEKSLQEGKLPDDWKVATVIPIFKKDNNSDVGNYRPVSLTPVPYKVLR